MSHDRYRIDKTFSYILSLTHKMDPILAQIDCLLDDEALYQLICADLAKRFPENRTDRMKFDPGRSGPAFADGQTLVSVQLRTDGVPGSG
jgi:hypothetical protein